MWLVFIVLTAVAMAQILLAANAARRPIKGGEVKDDLTVNRELYLEKIQQLQRQHDLGEISERQAKELELEHQRQLLAETSTQAASIEKSGGLWLVLVCALLIPAIAFPLYQYLGASADLDLKQLLAARSQVVDSVGKDSEKQLEDLTRQTIDALGALAAKHPQEPLYPLLLARISFDAADFGNAASNYRQVVRLAPDDGQLWSEYAQALFLSNDQKLTEELSSAAQRAYQLAPANQTAIGLMGILSYQDGEYRRAMDYWEKALSLLPESSPQRAVLLSAVANAREKLGDSSLGAVSSTAKLSVAVAVGVDVSLPKDTKVFVFARAWQGSPMPLAAHLLRLGDLPSTVVLDESSTMDASHPLSSVSQLEVIARISSSGDPAPTSGDYEGRLGPVSLGEQTSPLELVIDHKIP